MVPKGEIIFLLGIFSFGLVVDDLSFFAVIGASCTVFLGGVFLGGVFLGGVFWGFWLASGVLIELLSDSLLRLAYNKYIIKL